jgi:hypothetical protein
VRERVRVDETGHEFLHSGRQLGSARLDESCDQSVSVVDHADHYDRR